MHRRAGPIDGNIPRSHPVFHAMVSHIYHTEQHELAVG